MLTAFLEKLCGSLETAMTLHSSARPIIERAVDRQDQYPDKIDERECSMTIETTIETKTAQRVECPSCGQKAKRLSAVTLGALLKHEFAGPFAVNGHSCCDSSGVGCKPVSDDTGWRFCNSQECEVVYFSEEGDMKFTKAQLKVPVGVKEATGERPLCYCFGDSVASMKDKLRTKGRLETSDRGFEPSS